MEENIIIAILLSLVVVGDLSIIQTLYATAEKVTGVIVPLYVRPDSKYWNTIIDTKNAHPNVPMIVIVNPNNGPGQSLDEGYKNVIKKLQTAGIIVLGYTATDYAWRSSSRVMDYIDKYKAWYNINGILFDEMSRSHGKEDYYKALSEYAESKDLKFTVGNAGADIPEVYVGAVDNIIAYESAGLPSLADLESWHSKYLNQFSITAYDVNILNQSYLTSAEKYVSNIYITNDSLPNPWNSLPPYFYDLVEILDDQAALKNGTE